MASYHIIKVRCDFDSPEWWKPQLTCTARSSQSKRTVPGGYVVILLASLSPRSLLPSVTQNRAWAWGDGRPVKGRQGQRERRWMSKSSEWSRGPLTTWEEKWSGASEERRKTEKKWYIGMCGQRWNRAKERRLTEREVVIVYSLKLSLSRVNKRDLALIGGTNPMKEQEKLTPFTPHWLI